MPQHRVELRFTTDSQTAETHTNLSAVRTDGPGLWVAGDETATIEHLVLRDGRYDDQRGFALADFVDLPAGREEEADIEGIARDDGWLWAVGSHSLKRRRVKGSETAKAHRRLSTVIREENRFTLVRLPLIGEGTPHVRPVREDGERTAAILAGRDDNLAAILQDDPHLAPFLAIPGKDNGLDIEGIAVRKGRFYIGLRGPVLRGWAVLLEIRPKEHRHDRLRLADLDDGEGHERKYRKHFVNLRGLGVRDLCPHGDDLLILAGPSMDLDGPVRIVRWPGAMSERGPAASGLITAADLEEVAEPAYGVGDDHPEGLAVLADGSLMVVYDSPAPERFSPAGGVYADILEYR
ncbi:DUF3616 domain-containing protein [Spongiactinospora sp. TRM90649]|uniref:DUF3616 domain-containing protein n=1 Tax=Spongiactinospora sp. TRM90649 TaxID=3031114 RepID=UPI0023F9A68D|nr:DUF3616 domain-containing protein [Spongiactinospora sp. TRM90649]MDF5755317.1 DUF3616 domain-containing protein [Spongiactinospora sp. TRM90649]